MIDKYFDEFLISPELRHMRAKEKHNKGGPDLDGYFKETIQDTLKENPARQSMSFDKMRQKCLVVHNKCEFDNAEVKFCSSVLNSKKLASFKVEQDIVLPDGHISSYFDSFKRKAWRNIRKEEKIKKQRDQEKLEEQKRHLKEKQLLLNREPSEDENNIKILHRNKLLDMMYKNPNIFKVNTIVQRIADMKKAGYDAEDDPFSIYNQLPPESNPNHPLFSQQSLRTRYFNTAKETNSLTISALQESFGQIPSSKPNLRSLSRELARVNGLLSRGGRLGGSTRGLAYRQGQANRRMGNLFEVFRQQKEKEEREGRG